MSVLRFFRDIHINMIDYFRDIFKNKSFSMYTYAINDNPKFYLEKRERF